jgi:hypothetical protein
MDFPQEQIDELKAMFPGISHAEEGEFDFFFIPGLKLPPSCSPESIDVLFCPNQRGGYNSRLHFASMVQSGKALNWNGQNEFILGRRWFAFSWQLPPAERRLSQMVALHLRGLIC